MAGREALQIPRLRIPPRPHMTRPPTRRVKPQPAHRHEDMTRPRIHRDVAPGPRCPVLPERTARHGLGQQTARPQHIGNRSRTVEPARPSTVPAPEFIRHFLNPVPRSNRFPHHPRHSRRSHSPAIHERRTRTPVHGRAFGGRRTADGENRQSSGAEEA
ncbi:MAG: hypothetical protein RLZZ179_3426 [Verrucomicrobiota bacterium]|jgi:hypothetical protein